MLETYLAKQELPTCGSEDGRLLWLLDQMTAEERREWEIEAAFLESIYPEYPDADYEIVIREADRRIEAGLMPSEEEILAKIPA